MDTFITILKNLKHLRLMLKFSSICKQANNVKPVLHTRWTKEVLTEFYKFEITMTILVFRLIKTILMLIIPGLSWSGSSGGASMVSGTSRSSARMRPGPRSSVTRSPSPSVSSPSSPASGGRWGLTSG